MRCATVALLFVPGAMAFAEDLTRLREDRKAIERVYYNHRLGQKRPFQEVLTAAQLKAYLMAKQPFGETVTTLGHVLSSHLWLHEMVPGLFQEIRDTLAALSPQSALPPDATQLKNQVDRSGLNYESKVQRMLMGERTSAVAALAKDLKGQLLELSHRLDMLTYAETNPRSREARLSWSR